MRPTFQTIPLRTLLLVLAVGGHRMRAAEPPATPPPTPESAPQHVTVPALPGQPNREGTVRPDGGLATDAEGNSVTRRMSVDAGTPTPTPSAGARPAGAAPNASGTGGTTPARDVPPATSGKAPSSEASTLTIRAVVSSFEPEKSITVRVKVGSRRSVVTYALAPDAAVPAGLKPGESVRLRILVQGKSKVADRVERVTRK